LKHDARTGFAERLKSAAEAKKALLEQLKAQPSVPATDLQDRDAKRAGELKQVRQVRARARADRKQAAEDAAAAVVQAEADREAEALAQKRGERKERKASTQAEAKAKRDARYAARKARGGRSK
jgi:hypothetical protein